jgi:sigma-E factor negative regulatory protein RseB
MMPLRRELYDTSGHEISNDSFLSIQIGAIVLPQLAGSSAATAQTARSWTAAAAPGTFVTSLAARGWEVPASSPGGLPLYAAASTTTSSGEVVDLEYSDGLYDISLFVERGTLAPEMPGWQPANLPGQRVYVSGPSVTWARDGFVYTMIDDVPPQTVTDAVNGVPEGSPGTVDRLGRGLVRLVHAVNPFD